MMDNQQVLLSDDALTALLVNHLPIEPIPAHVSDRVQCRVLETVRALRSTSRANPALLFPGEDATHGWVKRYSPMPSAGDDASLLPSAAKKVRVPASLMRRVQTSRYQASGL